MKKIQPLIRVFSPFLAFGAVWLSLLPFHEPVAKWCTITVDEPLIAGSDARLAVGLHGLEAPSVLSVDLHWYDAKRENRGYLAGAARVRVPEADSSAAVSIPIKKSGALGFVGAVIYLSPDGSWAHRTRAAHSGRMRVLKNGGAPRAGRRVERKCYESGEGHPLSGPEPVPGDPPLHPLPWYTAYYAAGLLCVLCGALSLLSRAPLRAPSRSRSRVPSTAPSRVRGPRPWCWILMGAFTAAIGLMEQTTLGPVVTGLARRFFVARGLYHGHQTTQKLLIAGLAAAAAAFAARARRLFPERLPFPFALALFGVAGAVFAKVLCGISYHYFETFFQYKIFSSPGIVRALPAIAGITFGTLGGLFFAGLAGLGAVLRLFARKNNFLHS